MMGVTVMGILVRCLSVNVDLCAIRLSQYIS